MLNSISCECLVATVLWTVSCAHVTSTHVTSTVGPPYPITAAWFKDRFTLEEWNTTLGQFRRQGGDTVMLRAPRMMRRTVSSLSRDPTFQWCLGSSGGRGARAGVAMCWEELEEEMQARGVNVTAFYTYQYEEGFSDAIIRCPQFEKKISSSRIYYLLVLPTAATAKTMNGTCGFTKGSEVVVLLTSYAGLDPHHLLLEAAAGVNMSVYFSLPGAPLTDPRDPQGLMTSYYSLVERVMAEHKARYSNVTFVQPRGTTGRNNTLYDVIVGYYSPDETDLPFLSNITDNQMYRLAMYNNLGQSVKSFNKRFAMSTGINTNKFLFRYHVTSSVDDHVKGFINLVLSYNVDVIIVNEGRGAGKAAYYWHTFKDSPIKSVDYTLYSFIKETYLKDFSNFTFSQIFAATNRDILPALQITQSDLNAHALTSTDVWLNVEAYESLHDDPCLPVDTRGSAQGQMLDRAAKDRVDEALSVGGSFVQKISSFAWDSDFTCVTSHHQQSLHDEILTDLNRPIITSCSFVSATNSTIVLTGFNLAQEVAAFSLLYTNDAGDQCMCFAYATDVKLDYGKRNHLVESLEQATLKVMPEMAEGTSGNGDCRSRLPFGTVRIRGKKTAFDCYIEY